MSLISPLLDDAGPAHATLIDPATSSPEEAGRIASAADAAGTDLFLLGGSTDVTAESVERTLAAIQEASDRSVVLFPSGAGQYAPGLDGMLFTVTFNSKRPEYIVEEQARGSGLVLEAGIETINTAYVIVEPGMTVGEVAQADLVTRDEAGAERTRRYASLAQVLRFDAVYLEAGSGAPEPVPAELIEAAAEREVPVIVGGGIRTPEAAEAAARAGADLIVTGTLAEDGDLEALAELVERLDKTRT